MGYHCHVHEVIHVLTWLGLVSFNHWCYETVLARNSNAFFPFQVADTCPVQHYGDSKNALVEAEPLQSFLGQFFPSFLRSTCKIETQSQWFLWALWEPWDLFWRLTPWMMVHRFRKMTQLASWKLGQIFRSQFLLCLLFWTFNLMEQCWTSEVFLA